MDATDRKILAVLQADASLSVAEIGNRVGLSTTPCWKRIQRLEADGVILRRVAPSFGGDVPDQHRSSSPSWGSTPSAECRPLLVAPTC
jgi:hypothetical protein